MTSKKWIAEEIQIPISFGHIAAKVWGKENLEPVLALHGWQDNAATFDKLIPFLQSNLKIVAIDAAGHGFSSHIPLGSHYHSIEMIVDLKHVVKYLKWDKFSFIGHSMGGQICLMYSSIYPEQIKNIVLLDISKPPSVPVERLPVLTRNSISDIITFESKLSNKMPVYSYEEARNRLMSGMFATTGSYITSEVADILLTRGCKPSSCGKGVVFSRDIRIAVSKELLKLSHEDLKVYLRRIKSNLLVIAANQSLVFKTNTPEVLDDFFLIYKENCKSFKIVYVDGNHFVHLTNPEIVASYIDTFFSQHIQNLSKL